MRVTNLDGTALDVIPIAGDDNHRMVLVTSPGHDDAIDVLLNDTDQAELIVDLLATRTPPTPADADALAERLHRGQIYGEGEYAEPYIAHPRDVADRVRDNGDHAVMAALLHDVVEDTPCTLAALAGLGYPQQVLDAVDAVTHRKGDETYMEFIRRASRHPLGRIIKLASNASNTAKLDRIADAERRKFLTDRYERARRVLFLAGPA